MIAYMCVKKKQSLLNAFMLVLDHMLLLFVVYEKLAECIVFNDFLLSETNFAISYPQG